MPKADVDLPLPWPVTTMNSGLSRGLRRLGSALPRSSGGCMGMRRPPAGAARPRAPPPAAAPGPPPPRPRRGEPLREAEPDGTLLAVEHDHPRRGMGEARDRVQR